MLVALLPLLLRYVPEFIHLFAGDTAGATADKVADVVQSVVGSSDPAEVKAAFDDPSKLADLRLGLARIEADRQATLLRASQDELVARLSDVANARQQTMTLAQTGSLMGFGAPIISFIVLATLALLAAIVVWRPMPPGSETLISALLETFKVLSVSVVGYWVGSSAGSARKDVTIAKAATVPLAMGVAQ